MSGVTCAAMSVARSAAARASAACWYASTRLPLAAAAVPLACFERFAFLPLPLPSAARGAATAVAVAVAVTAVVGPEWQRLRLPGSASATVGVGMTNTGCAAAAMVVALSVVAVSVVAAAVAASTTPSVSSPSLSLVVLVRSLLVVVPWMSVSCVVGSADRRLWRCSKHLNRTDSKSSPFISAAIVFHARFSTCARHGCVLPSDKRRGGSKTVSTAANRHQSCVTVGPLRDFRNAQRGTSHAVTVSSQREFPLVGVVPTMMNARAHLPQHKYGLALVGVGVEVPAKALKASTL